MTNIFNKEYDEKEHLAFIDEQREHARIKSYYEKRRSLYIFSIVCSFFLNLWSALTMSFAAFALLQFLCGNVWVSGTISIIALFGFEKFKRLSSDEFYKIRFFENKTAFNWLFVLLAVFAASVFASGWGTKKGVEKTAPSAEMMAKDSTLKALILDINSLEKENRLLESKKNDKNETYYHALASIKENNKVLAAYRLEKLSLEKDLSKSNVKITKNHKNEINYLGWILTSITCLFEIIFHCLFCYKWHYRARCYKERGAIEKAKKERQNKRGTKTKADKKEKTKRREKGSATNEGETIKDSETPTKTSVPKQNKDSSTKQKGQGRRQITVRERQNDETIQDYTDFLLAKRKSVLGCLNKYKRRLESGEGKRDTLEKGIDRYDNTINRIDELLKVQA